MKIFFFIFCFFISFLAQANEMINELKNLNELHKSGALTNEEFTKTKEIILKKYSKKNITSKKSSNPDGKKNSSESFNNLLNIYNKLELGPSDANIVYKGIKGKFEKSVRWDTQFIAFYIEEHKFICVLKNPFSLHSANPRNQTYYDLKCSDGLKSKRGPAVLLNSRGGIAFIKVKEKNKTILELKIYNIYGYG